MQVNNVSEKLKSTIAPFVTTSKSLAASPSDQSLSNNWNSASSRLLDVVSEVTRLFDDLNMYGMDSARPSNQPQQPQPQQMPMKVQVLPTGPNMSMPMPPKPPKSEQGPPRPPAPAHDTDDEEGLFATAPGTNRPIKAAAHGLYKEVSKVKNIRKTVFDFVLKAFFFLVGSH